MSFDWNAYLAFAQELVSDDNAAEEKRRSAASRAYYAVFHCAKTRLENDGEQMPSAKVHAFVIKCIGEDYGTKGDAVSLWLKRFKEKRVDADYKTDIIFSTAPELRPLFSNMKRVIEIDIPALERGGR